MTVVRQFRGIEVNTVRGAISEATCLDLLDGRDLLWNMIRGAAPDVRLLDVQMLQVLLEGLRVQLGNLPRSHAGTSSPGQHLVLTRIRIGDKVSDIRNIDDVLDAIAIELQHAAQHIFEHIGTQVADVCVVIHRRPAGIQTDHAGQQWLEFPQLAGPGIEEVKRHGKLFQNEIYCCSLTLVSLNTIWLSETSVPAAVIASTLGPGMMINPVARRTNSVSTMIPSWSLG